MRKTITLAGCVVLVVSLSYNLAWVLSADKIREMNCKAHLAIVRADAQRSKGSGEWLVAAHQYAHLLHYGDDAPAGCYSDLWKRGGWALPLAALALEAGNYTPSLYERERERQLLQADYREALRHAGLPDPDQHLASQNQQ
jgi:hypothetical protein